MKTLTPFPSVVERLISRQWNFPSGRKFCCLQGKCRSEIHHFNYEASFWKFVKISSYCSYEKFERRFGFSTQTLVLLRVFKLLAIVMLIL